MAKGLARAGVLIIVLACSAAPSAVAADRLCDPGLENCRTLLINLIRAEMVGIDVGFWFMEDARFSTELIKRWQAGVPIRVLVDERARITTPLNDDRLAELRAAGIPMRERLWASHGILHWKTMLFAGQNTVEFSGANFSAEAWTRVSIQPLVDYVDEAIFFTGDAAIVNTFRTKFDDLWTDTRVFGSFANVTGPLARRYDTFPVDPRMAFGGAAYAARSTAAIAGEGQGIDAIMYRITDPRNVVAVLQARMRGVPVRLISEPDSYRPSGDLSDRDWYAWHAPMIDLMYRFGVQIRHRAHAGVTHQKSVILRGSGMTIFGSSNWDHPANDAHEQHNMFTTDTAIFGWFDQQFDRKWNNTAAVVETVPFTPLPPDKPHGPTPGNGATGVSPAPGLTLAWTGGPWAHLYDIYMGLSPTDLKRVGSNLPLGPGLETQQQHITMPVALPAGTLIYWQVVSRTYADLTRTSNLWSFTTAAAP
jgi:phosphatidylserine/phosphatidylglycerophosphate/cardiolipin synthase-like enzyme